MGICQESEITSDYMFAKLISLNEIWIESIEYKNIIIFRRVREIRPVEAICHVIFMSTSADM